MSANTRGPVVASAGTFSGHAWPGTGIAAARTWWRQAALRLRNIGVTYELDPHLAADTGLTVVKLPLLPRRTTTSRRAPSWME